MSQEGGTDRGSRNLHSEVPHILYPSLNILKMKESRRLQFPSLWTEIVARMWYRQIAYNIIVGTPGGKRPLRRPGCRWKDNIKMVFEEIERDFVECIHMA
jgi:hypothetical protein